MSRLVAVLLAVASTVPAVHAANAVQVQINGNTASASIQLPPDLSVDLTLTFEQVSGLTAQNLGLSAGLVDLTGAGLLARLPQGGSIPAALPVLITIEPPASGSLSFNGVVAITLHTEELGWSPNTPLRLFAAPLGGSFVDITSGTSSGSYRAGANKGGFSEFLVVADLRSLDTVIAAKFDALQSLLTGHALAIPSGVRASLQSQLNAGRSAFEAGNAGGAASTITSFEAAVKEHSGSSIPDLWRASRDVANVAGELRAAASTLRYSLLLKASSGA